MKKQRKKQINKVKQNTKNSHGVLLKVLKAFYWCICISAVSVVYIIYESTRQMPDYNDLDKYYPPSVTRIFSSDGKLIRQYYTENRIFVPFRNIPKTISEAFIAAEDKHFYHHKGLDFLGILRAFFVNIYSLATSSNHIEGGSTITQQVVKNMLLTSERSIKRKIQEAILAYVISNRFSKERVLELYLNQVFLGNNSYGVAVAAQNYFNKSLEELNIAEIALLAGLPKAPSVYNPKKHPEKALVRRNYVINRMLEDGYISYESAKHALSDKVILRGKEEDKTILADYFADRVSNIVIDLVGKEEFLNGGFTIITTLNSDYQTHANNALRKGIEMHDIKQGYRKNQYKYNAIVKKVSEAKVTISIDNKDIDIDKKYSMLPLNKLKKDDRLYAIGLKNGKYKLIQYPEINGALFAMEPNTGKVLAMVGGYNYEDSKFDRASQAKRQIGSLVKPFVYLAALEKGIEPNQVFIDEPMEINLGNKKIWKPKNFDGSFWGEITMRRAIERSRNIVTIKLAQIVGMDTIYNVLNRFDLEQEEGKERYLSAALGAVETTLEKITAAYSTLANQGKQVPYQYIELIQDREGRTIYSSRKNKVSMPTNFSSHGRRIVEEDSSYQIISLLEGVVQRGSGRRAKVLNIPIAGKTGSTNNSQDAWFVGFTPDVAAGVFIGYDNPKSLNGLGGSVALPIFVDFMKGINLPAKNFKIPDSVRLYKVDYETGKPSRDGIIEALKKKNNSIFNNINK